MAANMDPMAEIEGKSRLLSMHMGASSAAAGMAGQQLVLLLQQFDKLKDEMRTLKGELSGVRDELSGVRGELVQERAISRLLRQENNGLRRQFDANGLEVMDVEMQHHQDEHSGDRIPNKSCERCAHLPDLVLTKATALASGPDKRKPICTFCWQTRRKCDWQSTCETCVYEGAICVRKRCGKGEECVAKGCMRLHPGQWDEMDPAWTVEEGIMPEQGVKVEVIDRP